MMISNNCNNCCQNCCQNCCNPNNNSQPPLVGGYIPKDYLEALPLVHNISGSWGPLSWEIDYDVTEGDISKDYFNIELKFFGTTIIKESLSETHPEIDVHLTISGVGLAATLGVDFTQNIIFLRGSLNFIVYSKTFDITLFKF